MGKKPVLTMVGLVWAGIALTGCNTCSSCRNGGTKYNASPTFQTRTKTDGAPTTPTMVGDAKQAPTSEATPGRLPDSMTNPAATKSSGIEQASGTNMGSSGVVPASTPSLSKPTAQSSLRPNEERGTADSSSTPPPAAPKSFDDGFPSRLTSGNEARFRTMPPLPVPSTPTAATTMPTLTTTPSTTNTTMPATPGLAGKSLPPIAPSGFDNGAPPAMPNK